MPDVGAPRITFRCPKHLIDAAQAAADSAGQPLGTWVRCLIEQATGVEAGDMRPGYVRFTPDERSDFGRAGGLAKAKNARKTRRKPTRKKS